MRIAPHFSAILFTFAFNYSALFAQTAASSSTFHVEKPVIVNFTQQADYERTHPVMLPKRFIEQGEDADKNFHPTFGPVPSDAKKFSIALPQIETRSISPEPKIVFDGIQDAGFLIPPDICGVAGETYVFETTNQQFNIYSKDGANVSTLSITNFFKPAKGNGYYDPHVLYDALRKRFLVCIDGFNSSGVGVLFVAVSKTSDPTGDWYVYGINGGFPAADLLDYPAMGYNEKWIVLTAHDFANSQFFHTTGIYTVSRDSVYKGKAITATRFTDGSVFGMVPVATQDSTVDDEYMVASSSSNVGGFGYIKLYTISGDIDTPAYAAHASIGVNHPWSNSTINAPQAGSGERLEVIDSRIENSLYLNGSIWFTHDVFVPAVGPTHSAVDWWQINPVNDSVKQFGRIEDPTGVNFYFYPSLGVNQDTDVMIGYSVSSPDIYPSSGYSFRQHSDLPNTMENGITFKDGQASYFKDFGSGRNRWGDFTFTAADPVDNSFWTFQEFAGTSNRWGTVIANAAGIACSGKPEAGIVTPLLDTVCFGSKANLSLVGNSSGVSGIDYNWQQSSDGITWSAAENSTDDNTLQTTQLYSTTYYRSIATCSNSGKSDTSAAKQVSVDGFIQPPTGKTICSPQIVTFTAKSNGTISWYPNLYSNNVIATGDTFVANVSSDTTFYASSGAKNFYSTGIMDSSKIGNYLPDVSKGLEFTALSDFILDSVYVYPKAAGNVTVNLMNSLGSIMVSTTTTIADSQVGRKTAIPLFYTIDGNSDYTLTAQGSTVKGLWFNQTGVSYPYTIPGIVQINRASDQSTSWYYFFYNWRISSGCGASKIPAHIDLDTVKLSITATNDSLCTGDLRSDTLTVSGAVSYSWQPGNVVGNMIIVSPTQTTTYTVTGIDSLGCIGTNEITVKVTDCTSGIKPVQALNNINVFPNPAQNLLNIQVGMPGSFSYSVSISNSLGINLISLSDVHFTTGKNFPVDISHLEAGIYYVTVESAGKKWIRTFNKL
jgi:Secretion system C-terminal sorting domain